MRAFARKHRVATPLLVYVVAYVGADLILYAFGWQLSVAPIICLAMIVGIVASLVSTWLLGGK